METLLAKVPIEDGGGLNSSADWLAPREAVDFFGDLRRHFISLAVQWNLVPRLQGLLHEHVDEPLLSLAEMQMVQQALVRFLCAKGFACSSVIVEHQPFLLDVWGAISLATCDIDCSLPGILTEGVPTGIIDSISPSGVWEQVCSPEEQPSDLLEPWGSAQNDEDLALSLLQKDIEAATGNCTLVGWCCRFVSQCTGNPIELEKIGGPTLVWLGWQFDFAGSWTSLPSSKLALFFFFFFAA